MSYEVSVHLLVITGLITFLFVIPAAYGVQLQRVARAVAVYFALEFLIRPIVVFWLKPPLYSGSSLSSVWWAFPTYEQSFTKMAPTIELGIFSFVLVVRVLGKRLNLSGSIASNRYVSSIRPWVLTYVASWLGRLLYVEHPTGSIGSLGLRLALLGLVSFGVVVLFGEPSKSRRRVLLAMGIGELVWSLAYASKTPVLACIFFLFLDPNRGHINIKQAAVAIFAVTFAFTLVQEAKFAQLGRSNTTEALHQSRSGLAATRLVERFDIINSVAAATSKGEGSYLSRPEFAKDVFLSFIPKEIAPKNEQVAGELWGTKVLNAAPGTSFATGATAEGYAEWGRFGVVAWNIILGVALLLTVRAVQSSSWPARILGTYLLSTTALVERGVFGLSEVLGLGLQVLVITAFLVWLFSREPSAERSSARRLGNQIQANVH